VAIGRERFWSLVEQTRVDLRATALAMPTDELIGYARWQQHFVVGLLDRRSIKAAGALCLQGSPEHDDGPFGAFAEWLVQQGEAVVEAAARDPDTIAECAWGTAPARGDDGRFLYELAASRGVDLTDPSIEPILDSLDWPEDRPESAAELASPPLVYRVFPRLAARLEMEFLRTTMPRAAWQREAQERNRWWGLAWDALESNELACEIPRFWRLVEMIGWPKPREIAPFETYGMPERVRFALRYHERFAMLERAVAARESTHGPLVTRDRDERIAGVIACGRTPYEAALANPELVRTSRAELGFGRFVDELRRAPKDMLLALLPTHLSERAHELAVGEIVIDYDRGWGFVAASSPSAPPDHVVYFDGAVPIKPPMARKPYSAKQAFAVGDLLAHPKFGDGEVIAKPTLGKILVRFADGEERVLVGPR